MNSMDVNLAAMRFERAAAELGRYLKARQGDRHEAQTAIEDMETAYATVEEANGQAALLPLLESPDEYVCLLSAKMLLLYDVPAALGALERLARRGTNASLHAKTYLMHWHSGFLWPQRPHWRASDWPYQI